MAIGDGDSSVLFNPDEFGVNVTITTLSGNHSFNAMLDSAGNTAFSGFMVTGSHQITAFTAELPNDIAGGNTLEINARSFKVIPGYPKNTNDPALSVIALEPA